MIILYNIIYKSTCDEFEKGFNNASVVNNDKNYGYNFKYQKFCQNKVLSNYQDLTIILWINFYLKISILQKYFKRFKFNKYIFFAFF